MAGIWGRFCLFSLCFLFFVWVYRLVFGCAYFFVRLSWGVKRFWTKSILEISQKIVA